MCVLLGSAYCHRQEGCLGEEAILKSRRADSENAKDKAVLKFARTVVLTRGEVADQEVEHIRTLERWALQTARSPKSWRTSL